MPQPLSVASPLPIVAAPALPAWLDRQAYPFTVRSTTTRAGRMSYVDEGAGDPILFVHGTPTWSFDYRHLIRALTPAYRCIAVDHLGFGLSDRPPDFPYTPEAHAHNLAELVAKLGLTRFTLVAHDFGGPIALPLAVSHPRQVRRLVLLNTWMWPFDDDPAMTRNARLAGGRVGRFLYRHLNASLRILMPGAYGARRKLTRAVHRQCLAPFPDADSRGRVLWPLARALLASRAHYQSLWQSRAALRDLPAQIIWGMKDPALPPRLLGRWREALPHAHIAELATAGHWPHEEAPAEVAAQIAAFLAR